MSNKHSDRLIVSFMLVVLVCILFYPLIKYSFFPLTTSSHVVHQNIIEKLIYTVTIIVYFCFLVYSLISYYVEIIVIIIDKSRAYASRLIAIFVFSTYVCMLILLLYSIPSNEFYERKYDIIDKVSTLLVFTAFITVVSTFIGGIFGCLIVGFLRFLTETYIFLSKFTRSKRNRRSFWVVVNSIVLLLLIISVIYITYLRKIDKIHQDACVSIFLFLNLYGCFLLKTIITS